jgi:hypothetical protein
MTSRSDDFSRVQRRFDHRWMTGRNVQVLTRQPVFQRYYGLDDLFGASVLLQTLRVRCPVEPIQQRVLAGRFDVSAPPWVAIYINCWAPRVSADIPSQERSVVSQRVCCCELSVSVVSQRVVLPGIVESAQLAPDDFAHVANHGHVEG